LNTKRIPFVLLTALALLAFLGGCAKPPTAEMEAAEAALALAESDSDAVAYGGSSIIRARDAVDSMKTEAAAKRYDSAKTFAQDAVTAAERAIADGRTGAQRARDEAASLLGNLRTDLGETQKNIDAAKGVRGIELDFDSIDGDYDGAKNQADQSQTALSGADYRGSIAKSQSARATLGNINTRISQASIATSRKK
jgi:hypothetical protein